MRLEKPAGAIIDLAPSRALSMPDPKPEAACKHKRTRVIAEDGDARYVECLDCGEILEAGELKEGESRGESLSDA